MSWEPQRHSNAFHRQKYIYLNRQKLQSREHLGIQKSRSLSNISPVRGTTAISENIRHLALWTRHNQLIVLHYSRNLNNVRRLEATPNPSPPGPAKSRKKRRLRSILTQRKDSHDKDPHQKLINMQNWNKQVAKHNL